jgi:hypothetical protein
LKKPACAPARQLTGFIYLWMPIWRVRCSASCTKTQSPPPGFLAETKRVNWSAVYEGDNALTRSQGVQLAVWTKQYGISVPHTVCGIPVSSMIIKVCCVRKTAHVIPLQINDGSCCHGPRTLVKKLPHMHGNFPLFFPLFF